MLIYIRRYIILQRTQERVGYVLNQYCCATADYILVSSLQAIHNNTYKDMSFGLPRYEGHEEIYCRCNEANRVGERR